MQDHPLFGALLLTLGIMQLTTVPAGQAPLPTDVVLGAIFALNGAVYSLLGVRKQLTQGRAFGALRRCG
jgi:hypothetical protein